MILSPLALLVANWGIHPARVFAAEKEESSMMGPAFHLGVGARFKKAPELDRYDSPNIGLKASLFGFRTDRHSYISLMGVGVSYIGDNRVAFSLTPIGFFHQAGIGLAFDLYSTRPDRTGGPYGLSLNFDILQIGRTAMEFAGR